MRPNALFKEFETVFYTRGELFRPGFHHSLSEREVDEFRTPFAYLIGGLQFIGEGASDILEQSRAVLVGAADFHPPKGLGSVRSQFCYILVADGRGLPELRTFFKIPPVAFVGKASIWTWKAKLGEYGEADPKASVMYATQVAAEYILVSNDLPRIQTTAKRLRALAGREPDMSRVPDWNFLRQRTFWGARIYRDSTTHKEAAGVSEVTPGAKALIFSLEEKTRSGLLRLLGSDGVEQTASNLNATGKIPTLEHVSPDEWQAVVTLGNDERSAETMFTIMGLFGFAIYL